MAAGPAAKYAAHAAPRATETAEASAFAPASTALTMTATISSDIAGPFESLTETDRFAYAQVYRDVRRPLAKIDWDWVISLSWNGNEEAERIRG